MPPPPTSKPRVRRVDVRDDDAVACRLFTLAEVARMFGKDRKTMDQWIEYGCPTHSMAGPKVIVDLASVLAWRERYVTERATRAGRGRSPKIAVASAASEIPDDAGSPSGAPSARELSPADLLKLEQIKLTKLKIGQQAEILIPRSLAEAAFERAMGLVKQAVMSVPERISRKMAGAPQEKVLAWREEALGHCRAALAEGAKAIAVAMPSFVAGTDAGSFDDQEDAE